MPTPTLTPTILPNLREDAFKELEKRIGALLDLVAQKSAEIEELKRQRQEDDLAQIQRLVDMITVALETPPSVPPTTTLRGLLDVKGEPVVPVLPPLGPS